MVKCFRLTLKQLTISFGIMQIFFVSYTFNLGVSLLGIIVFSALTAYDMQKIKHMQEQSNCIC
ncbi:Bax inhibitor-1 family protein [Clostridium sp.]|uniref:Bax inhibitor-1 family protein n=1 Tax=Clostridium sp. TaxID=1506 RepID=UPI0039C893D8